MMNSYSSILITSHWSLFLTRKILILSPILNDSYLRFVWSCTPAIQMWVNTYTKADTHVTNRTVWSPLCKLCSQKLCIERSTSCELVTWLGKDWEWEHKHFKDWELSKHELGINCLVCCPFSEVWSTTPKQLCDTALMLELTHCLLTICWQTAMCPSNKSDHMLGTSNMNLSG